MKGNFIIINLSLLEMIKKTLGKRCGNERLQEFMRNMMVSGWLKSYKEVNGNAIGRL